MATIYQNLQSRIVGKREIHFNLSRFVQENLTRSAGLLIWTLALAYVTLVITVRQLGAAPVTTAIVFLGWLILLSLTVINEITRSHSSRTLWLRNNLFSSITNTLLSLALTLLIIAAIRGFIGWAFVRASFFTNPEVADLYLSQFQNPGANWGAVIVNFRNLMVFRWPQDQNFRLYLLLLWNILLLIPSQVVFRREQFRGSRLRRILTILWLLTPVIAFILLRGFGNGLFRALNPDIVWGGLLLTLIITFFAIIASFPLGLFLALGRRSTIRGVPAWLVWLITVVGVGYLLWTRTVPALEEARTTTARLLAFWPLFLLVIAYLFNRYFHGNVVALASTVYIEVIRGVPLITILFMSIILFPIFLPPGVEILGTWRVLVAAALFAAAYLAENVRGGLQSLVNGQYEAADAIGLSTAQKYRLIILPQALRAVIPAIVGQFIGLFKDTTLVAIVGLTELLGVANLISAQPDWLGVRREPYVFIAIIYFIGSALMTGYSRRLETRLGVGER